MTPIDSFQGEYRWLSNFWPALVIFDGDYYPTVEHAYQAAKTTDRSARIRIHRAETPGLAKKLGRGLAMRPDWDTFKLEVMLILLRQKFTDPELRRKLLETGDRELIEGNTWGDRFWGVCGGTGENHLGKILMHVREAI